MGLMNPGTLRNLTLASAKHLVTQGHISKAHHAKIMAKVKAPAMAPNKPPALPKANAPVQAFHPTDPGVPQGQPQVPMGALDAMQDRGPTSLYEG